MADTKSAWLKPGTRVEIAFDPPTPDPNVPRQMGEVKYPNESVAQCKPGMGDYRTEAHVGVVKSVVIEENDVVGYMVDVYVNGEKGRPRLNKVAAADLTPIKS